MQENNNTAKPNLPLNPISIPLSFKNSKTASPC